MKISKTITVYIVDNPEECPGDECNAGDLMFCPYQDSSVINPKKSKTHWAVYRFCKRSNGGFWAALSRFSHYSYIKEVYGVDLEGK